MRAAVLGHPIVHSLSPVLHRAAYATLGLDWTYDAVDVMEGDLADFVAGCGEDWAGLSLTMPLKRTVLPLLDEASSLVEAVGGANTVVFEEGRRLGHNTDVAGIVNAIRAGVPGVERPRVGIVGAGATAAAALMAAGQLQSPEVLLAARRPIAAANAVAHSQRYGVRATTRMWSDLPAVLACDIVIVTLPGDTAAPLAELVPGGPGLLLDVTYDPWPTTLAAAWLTAGGLVLPGHRMLLWQAVDQVRLMTGMEPPIEAMTTAIDAALRS